MKFFKIRSWHIIDPRRHEIPRKAYCGQRIRHTSEVSNDLDLNDKSCETCLRLDKDH